MVIPLPLPQKGGGPPKFLAHVYCDQTVGWMKLILGTVVGLNPGKYVLDGDPAPYPKRGRAPSPILSVEVENFEIGLEVGALLVIANFVALEQQIILVKTRSESLWKWQRYNRLNFGALALHVNNNNNNTNICNACSVSKYTESEVQAVAR